MYRQFLRCGLAAACAAVLSASTFAAEGNPTAAEATAMVKKGVAYIKANGKEKGYAAFTDKNPAFIDRDLYLVAYGMDGVVRAHGANAKMVGKDMSNLKDIDGKLFIKERLDLAAAKSSFWQDYKFTDPVSKKIAPKSMYCERLDDAIICGGVYK